MESDNLRQIKDQTRLVTVENAKPPLGNPDIRRCLKDCEVENECDLLAGVVVLKIRKDGSFESKYALAGIEGVRLIGAFEMLKDEVKAQVRRG